MVAPNTRLVLQGKATASNKWRWRPPSRNWKAEENLKSDTECPFFARKQPILRAVGSSCKNSNENGEDIFELSSDDDDAISTNSGEDCRETVTCEACSEMFWKVINKKETKKKGRPSGKKQPYDPTSLSCDQWVLRKPLLPRSHQQKLGREISYLNNWIGTSVPEVTRKWIPQCSRPHVFLQRNLRSCRRKVDDFLAEHSKKQPKKKTRKRSRKKELFVFMLPETLAPSTVISDNEDSEMKITTIKRKLTSAVLSREERTKKGSCDFSDDLNSCESGFYSSDSKSVQCKSGNFTNPAFNSTHLNFSPGKAVPAFSISTSLCSENQLRSTNEKAKTWEPMQRNINSRITPSSFGWLKPGGFTSMIAKLKARSLTSSGSVVKET
ncbi:uncharacterized protein si:ch211-227n13.3 isoform X2 [Scyliorhinus canicula]|uniref:uncharacterized protein si:ch211-227n13.3 isoform X2 n=1 Tax=Scyliorhinus canicula TaxID=7830 RepID=UPI0018F76663|nr:uncharacterized protein si:ch211-227n13.3 isoform X2 [Scyliorhinus canicula]